MTGRRTTEDVAPRLPARVVLPGFPGRFQGFVVDPSCALVWCVDEALTATECDELLEWVDTLDLSIAPITTAIGPVMRPDIRNNDRAMVDHPGLAAMLYDRVAHTIPMVMYDAWRPIGLNERLRVYRYGPGQVFAPHIDGSFRRSNVEESQLTLMFYLDEGCEGGATRFLDGRTAVVPKRGMALLFQHRILHEGALVTAGRKTVLRTDVMFRRDA